MQPTFSLTVRFKDDGEEWVFESLEEAPSSLEWFDRYEAVGACGCCKRGRGEKVTNLNQMRNALQPMRLSASPSPSTIPNGCSRCDASEATG